MRVASGCLVIILSQKMNSPTYKFGNECIFPVNYNSSVMIRSMRYDSFALPEIYYSFNMNLTEVLYSSIK